MERSRGLVVVLLILCVARAAPADGSCSPVTVVARLREGRFTEIKKVSDIAQDLLAEFWRTTPAHGLKAFADPDAEFQATDVIDQRNLPWRRLIFAGRSPSISFVYYEKGGIALSRHVFVTCSMGQLTRSFSYVWPPDAKDSSSLFTRLRSECLVTPPREYPEKAELDRCVR